MTSSNPYLAPNLADEPPNKKLGWIWRTADIAAVIFAILPFLGGVLYYWAEDYFKEHDEFITVGVSAPLSEWCAMIIVASLLPFLVSIPFNFVGAIKCRVLGLIGIGFNLVTLILCVLEVIGFVNSE